MNVISSVRELTNESRDAHLMLVAVLSLSLSLSVSLFLYLLIFWQDTRTHTIGELYDTERSYVESLRTLVTVTTFR